MKGGENDRKGKPQRPDSPEKKSTTAHRGAGCWNPTKKRNGKNDEEVYKSGVKTVCLNPDDADFENKTLWHHVIMKADSLKAILPFIEES